MAYRLVILDFDGTLANTGDWFLTVIDHLAERYRLRRVTPDEIEMLRGKTTREVIDFVRLPMWKLPSISRYVRQLAARDVEQIALFPGTPALIEGIVRSGASIALVTSNSEANVCRILGPDLAARIDRLECGSSLFGKARKFRRVLRKTRIAAAETLSIGDETRDIEAARRTGIAAGAVLWGYATEDALAAMQPDALFATPEAVIAYVARGGAVSPDAPPATASADPPPSD